MEEEIDNHHVDGTSPLMESALLDIQPSPVACLSFGPKPLSMSSSMASIKSKSSSREEIDCISESSALMTPMSTPSRPKNLPARLSAGTPEGPRDGNSRANSLGVGTCVSVTVEEIVEERLRAPIVGYEIMEQRAKFTVFKIHVRKSDRDNWLIFRRYTDFVRVNDKLREIFPIFRLSLPPKRWFGSNFDQNFLEDRQLGLQAFIDNIIGHKEIVLSGPAREFLCLDDPPGPHDSIEESRALCESLDETVYNLRKELSERDKRIALLSAEFESAQQHIALLNQHLVNQSCNLAHMDNSLTPVSGECSTIEGDIHSQAEADQSMSFASADHNTSQMPSNNAASHRTSESQSEVTLRLTSRDESDSRQGHDGNEYDEELNGGQSQTDIITVT